MMPGLPLAIDHVRSPPAAPIHLNVSETFTTHQGEGRHQGALAHFIRLTGCNLTCSWCDAAYTWDWRRYRHEDEVHQRTPHDLADEIDALQALGAGRARVVITGGEPLLQSNGLAALFAELDACDLFAHHPLDLETNGTRPLGPTARFWSTITCSPKVGPSAGQIVPKWGAPALDPSIKGDDRTEFKFVVAGSADLDAAVEFAAHHSLPRDRCWLMPEGTTPATILDRTPWVTRSALMLGWNFTSRLHILAYGDTRGT